MQQKTVYQLTGYELGSLTTEITMQTTSTSLQVTVRVKVRGPNGLSNLYYGCYLSAKALTWVSQTAVTSLAANQKSGIQWGAISTRWQYWSRIKSWTVFVQDKFFLSISKQSRLSSGPVSPPGGDDTPLINSILSTDGPQQ